MQLHIVDCSIAVQIRWYDLPANTSNCKIPQDKSFLQDCQTLAVRVIPDSILLYAVWELCWTPRSSLGSLLKSSNIRPNTSWRYLSNTKDTITFRMTPINRVNLPSGGIVFMSSMIEIREGGNSRTKVLKPVKTTTESMNSPGYGQFVTPKHHCNRYATYHLSTLASEKVDR
jgi:hypothetical protein